MSKSVYIRGSYNSKSLRRQKRQKRFENLIMAVFLVVGFITIAAVMLLGLWVLLSFINISANAPAMAGQVPVYWENNLILYFLR